MKTWGEAGVVKEPKCWKSKLGKCGREAMFVGYALNGPSDTLRMYVPETNAIRETRNIQWMKKMYYQEDNSLPDVTVDSLELLMRNGKVKS